MTDRQWNYRAFTPQNTPTYHKKRCHLNKLLKNALHFLIADYILYQYSSCCMSQISGRQACLQCVHGQRSHSRGFAAHHFFLLIIHCCLSNKEGQCDRHIVSLFQATAGQKGDKEQRQTVVACLSPIHPPHTDTDVGEKGSLLPAADTCMYRHPMTKL